MAVIVKLGTSLKPSEKPGDDTSHPAGEDRGTSPGELTRLIHEHREGSVDAGDRLFALLYEELRRLAGAFFRNQRPDHTLQPTALVHEAFLRLGAGRVSEWDGRSHVLGVAAQAMRNVLADHARRNLARKRKGRRVHLPLTAAGVETPTSTMGVLDLAFALDHLAEQNPRQAQVVDLRFFCGLGEVEVAAVLGVSERTVREDWRLARTKLRAFFAEEA